MKKSFSLTDVTDDKIRFKLKQRWDDVRLDEGHFCSNRNKCYSFFLLQELLLDIEKKDCLSRLFLTSIESYLDSFVKKLIIDCIHIGQRADNN